MESIYTLILSVCLLFLCYQCKTLRIGILQSAVIEVFIVIDCVDTQKQLHFYIYQEFQLYFSLILLGNVHLNQI